MTRNYLSTALTVMLAFSGLSLIGVANAQPVTKKTLKAAITTAETPQDHQRIAAYYKREAGRMLAEAKEHDELAVAYTKSPMHSAKHPMSPQTAEHCKYFADMARKSVQAYQEMAKLHEDMAKPAK